MQSVRAWRAVVYWGTDEWDDPIIAEIHKFRDEFARKHNYDIDAMIESLRERAKEYGHETITYLPKPAPKRRST